MGLAILHFTDLAMVGSWEFYTVAFEAIAQLSQGFYIAKISYMMSFYKITQNSQSFHYLNRPTPPPR